MTKNLRTYIDSFSKYVIDAFEEDYGINGWDMLLACESKEEVDDLLMDYQ